MTAFILSQLDSIVRWPAIAQVFVGFSLLFFAILIAEIFGKPIRVWLRPIEIIFDENDDKCVFHNSPQHTLFRVRVENRTRRFLEHMTVKCSMAEDVGLACMPVELIQMNDDPPWAKTFDLYPNQQDKYIDVVEKQADQSQSVIKHILDNRERRMPEEYYEVNLTLMGKEEIPSGFVGDSNSSLKLFCRDPFLGFQNQVNGDKPLSQRQVAVVEDGSSSDRELIATGIAIILIPLFHFGYAGISALWTSDPIRPAQFFQVGTAIVVAIKPVDNSHQVNVLCFRHRRLQ
ncbi:hypothetical protein MYX82_03795 [Acidobacteria bacterium AH-259-D05]|nr:hypothetical protein [Acidobacteria bacterium AH-259-D05]